MLPIPFTGNAGYSASGKGRTKEELLAGNEFRFLQRSDTRGRKHFLRRRRWCGDDERATHKIWLGEEMINYGIEY